MGNLLITGGKVVLPELGETAADLFIRDGRVASIGKCPGQTAEQVFSAEGCYVLPGLIDPHVHLGNYRPFDHDVISETRAAARGGVTTLITFLKALRHRDSEDSYLPILEEVKEVVESHSLIDVGLHVVLSSEQHLDEIEACFAAGIRSFKMYMGYRSDPAARKRGSVGVSDGYIFRAMSRIGRLPGAMALVHCENEEIAQSLAEQSPMQDWSFAEWAGTRPALIEAEAIQRAAFLSEQARCPFYAVHVSSADALHVLHKMGPRTSPLYVETNLHHLVLTLEDGASMPIQGMAKVSPPLRRDVDVEALWTALIDGRASTVGTDHCCVDEAAKLGDAKTALPGFPALDNLGEVLLSEALRREVSMDAIARFTSYNAARIFGLYPRKGTLLPGADGDAVIVRCGPRHFIDADDNSSASHFSPYDGREVTVELVATIRRGEIVFDRRDDSPRSGAGGRLVLAK